ncbi:Nucleolar protein 12 [Phytophthora palmivora]|uniref:Nucleolar protein 12 n=1 Tax=Phytophthora palmivora TaxID=4796 RepID=A0A2P4XC52_9STRA|nr:Nucleolar protein 12 [Phytophthora palmivora]
MAPATHGATSRQGKRGAVGKAKHGRGSTGVGANPNVRKKSKLVVTFDPDKRKEYLTGFHKRKQERRRFGLDMEAYKVKKRQLEAKKQRREEQKEKLAALNLLDDDKEEEEQDSDSDASEDENKPVLGGKSVTKVMTFNDDFTQGKFGDVVTVTTSVGDLQSDSDDSGSDLEPSDEEDDEADKPKHPAFRQKKKVDKEQHLTLFQRIQQQRRGKALPSKRSKLKDARAARKAMMGKGSVVTGKKRGAEGGDGGSAISKLNKKLKTKRSQGGNKRNKKR